MLIKLTDDIHGLIVQANAQNSTEAIPHSDAFIRDVTSIFSVEPYVVRRVIAMLRDAHKILSLEVIQEDKQKEIKKIEGYVDAEPKTVKRLKVIFQNALMDEYELKNSRRLMTHQIIKEIYNKIAMYKNTPMGQLANKAIMLEEFEYLLEKNYREYTDEWKSKKLAEILSETADAVPEKGAVEIGEIGNEGPKLKSTDANRGGAPDNKRAIDTEQYQEISQSVTPQSVAKMIQIYGINFFFRVQLRKYNFRQLRTIVEGGIIKKRDDLKLLKDLIKTVRQNAPNDPELEAYTSDLNDLEQTVSHYMLYVRR